MQHQEDFQMGLIDLASSASAWRGYEYYQEKRVLKKKQIDENTISGEVSGSGQNTYHVTINLAHPRSSSCDCPHANGKRIVCKHMVALYFAAFPKEAQTYYAEVMEAEEEAEAWRERMEERLIAHVHQMKKPELQQALLQLLFEGPEWQYERFLRENIDEYYE